MEEFANEQLEEQKQNHSNEIEALKKDVSDLKRHLEMLPDKKRKYARVCNLYV